MLKKALLLVTISFYMVSIGAQAPHKDLIITPLKGNAFVFTTFGDPGDGTKYPANGMYILTNIGAVLIDSPWDTTQFQPLLDSIYAKHHQYVVLNIATHFHEDRTAGFEYYAAKGIKTYSSLRTLELCKIRNEKQAQYVFLKDTTFHVGDIGIDIYFPGHGHAPDNIVVWVKKHKILYGGCLVKSTETDHIGNLSDADIPAWKTTMHRLTTKYPRPKFVIPGHLGWSNNQGISHTIEILNKHQGN